MIERLYKQSLRSSSLDPSTSSGLGTAGLSRILSASTLALAITLLWFAFVYYPKVVDDYKVGNFPKKGLIPQVAAISYKFPIETTIFRLDYDTGSVTYYAIIQGEALDEYVVNRDSAKLALKTALSLESLCEVNVIYVSAARLSIPHQFRADC